MTKYTPLIFTAIYFFIVSYSYLEGTREGFHYHFESIAYGYKKNMHRLFFAQRFLVFLLMVLFIPDIIKLPSALMFIFMFSFIHNGQYFITRNNLNKYTYPLREKDASENAKFLASLSFKDRIRTMWGMIKHGNGYAAVFDFTYRSRLIQLYIGLTIYLGTLIWLILKMLN